MLRTSAAFALAVLLAASALNGVCICKRMADAGGTRQGIVCVDVCGTSAGALFFHALDGTAVASAASQLYFPVTSLLPPEAGQAVATTDPGETGKPPEA